MENKVSALGLSWVINEFALIFAGSCSVCGSENYITLIAARIKGCSVCKWYRHCSLPSFDGLERVAGFSVKRWQVTNTLSLRSWRYDVLTAEPLKASGEAARRMERRTLKFRAPTIPPATQATNTRVSAESRRVSKTHSFLQTRFFSMLWF